LVVPQGIGGRQFALEYARDFEVILYGLVVDPFCGSGPVLEAAQKLARRAIGIEIEERYCAAAAERLCR
jgi:hypothetical protein